MGGSRSRGRAGGPKMMTAGGPGGRTGGGPQLNRFEHVQGVGPI